MIPLHHLKDKHVGVVGLGKAGRAAVAALHAGGAITYIWDDVADDVGLTPLDAWPWEQLDGLLLSPGVPLYLPQPHAAVGYANNHNVPIWGEVDLLYRECPDATYVGITGTNGKSTTTALLGHVLTDLLGADAVQVGGNLGTAALALQPLGAGGVYVIELSSYQLDLCVDLRCKVAIWLNLEADHLERHGTMARYGQAKERVFANQAAGDVAIVACADAPSQAVAEAYDAVKLTPDNGAGWNYGAGWVRSSTKEHYSLKDIASLQGQHNAQNASAVLAGVHALGLNVDDALQAMYGFAGLAHRMELVARTGAWQAVNDSKATNVAATKRSLGAFEHCFWLAGGAPKKEDYSSLLSLQSHVRQAYFYGEAAPMLMQQWQAVLPCNAYETLREACEAAMQDIEAAEVFATLLLAPACASFDQWDNFEQRGNAFKHYVSAHIG